MKWDRDEVSRLLNAKIVDESLVDGAVVTLVQFEDMRMQYELWIREDSVFLAADRERPIQGNPFFEITLPCVQLAPVLRSGMRVGIGIYSGPIHSTTLRFSITRRDDDSISLSGAYAGLTVSQVEATPVVISK